MLTLARDLIELRRQLPDLHEGTYRTLDAPDGVWAWSRGRRAVAALNLTDGEATVAEVDGAVRISTDRRRDGESITGSLHIGPWEALVAERGAPVG
jgi:alpha-glucosidase